MIVAVAALIVALGGTAIAGGVLNKKKVNRIINNRAPGLSVGSAKHADSAATAEDVLWATVSWPALDNISVVAAGQSGTTVTAGSGGVVHFPRNVQNCTWVASPARVPGNNGAISPAEVGVNGVADPNAVEVRYYTIGGSLTYGSFDLVVTC
jgi:hypothetical protein